MTSHSAVLHSIQLVQVLARAKVALCVSLMALVVEVSLDSSTLTVTSCHGPLTSRRQASTVADRIAVLLLRSANSLRCTLIATAHPTAAVTMTTLVHR